MKRLKVSREGIVLIKSFEGFRPRAVRREDGRWVIGYGHTLSAREGASVSEADAELLLQYDLLPVAEAVNDGVAGRVNQHQFDALASFAMSVGVDRFRGSDVLQRIRDGLSNEAADAMVGWPEAAVPETALRRRAAERALFVADPDAPVALADLLSAPLPPPPVQDSPPRPTDEASVDVDPVPADAPAVVEPVPADTGQPVASNPERPASEAGEPDGHAAPENAPALTDARSAALAHLLEPASTEASIADVEIVEPTATADSIAATSPEPETQVEPEPQPAALDAVGLEAGPSAGETDGGSAPAETETPQIAPILIDVATDVAAPSLQRYSAYGASAIGRLPAFDADSAIVEPVTHRIEFADPSPSADPVAASASVFPALTTETELPGGGEALVLTPLADGAFASTPRLVWPEESREGVDASQSPLFDEDATLHRTLGPVVRPEMLDNAPDRFNWGETGAYLLMGGFGLVSFGMAMAAFRLASQQGSGADDTTMIAWVLALIGAACVGVSSYNLYRRWGRVDEA